MLLDLALPREALELALCTPLWEGTEQVDMEVGAETKGRYMLTVIKFNVLARLSRFQVFSEFIICIFKHE